jgi:hypothetical protein
VAEDGRKKLKNIEGNGRMSLGYVRLKVCRVPHLDGIKQAVHTTSVWLPLSNATLLNRCVYVVKRTTDTNPLAATIYGRESFSRGELDSLLRNSRALPSVLGDVLCWGQKILYWGSTVESTEQPRISIAIEFTGAGQPPTECDSTHI